VKAIPFGPVRIRSDEDAQAFMASLHTPPKMLRGMPRKLQHVTLHIVPVAEKKTKKPKVAFHYLWGDWTGISFWG
jgi:hypothetical protein